MHTFIIYPCVGVGVVMQQTLTEVRTVDVRKEIKEVWRCQASENVADHAVLSEIDDSAIRGVEVAIRNTEPLANWNEYNTAL